MIYLRFSLIFLLLLLSACSTTSQRGTLAELQSVKPELKDAKVDDGLEKAMQSYKRFLAETPESAMTPEAIRRIADLSIEKEYGYVADSGKNEPAPAARADNVQPPEKSTPADLNKSAPMRATTDKAKIANIGKESDKDFEKRVAQGEKVGSGSQKGFSAPNPEGGDDLENANAEQAIKLYQKLLKKYPMYERNDQVLYQMSRAYEELGKVEKAMEVMNRFVKTYPTSHYIDEVQFRRAEYYFTHKKYLDSEDAYQYIVKMGEGSSYYELALYKLGWSYYKQEMYEEALNEYFALFDHKVKIGFDFDQPHDKTEKKRVEDTYRVISLSFSNLGGSEAVVDYFNRHGHRKYEDKVYSHLGEFYLTKRRYSDAASAYKTFIDLYPFHEVSPHFNMRVIDIYKKGGFAKLVVEAKKAFAKTYALDSEYWHYFDIKKRPEVVGYLKANLKDLANHYHALYQDKRFAKDKSANYNEALLWYRNYLSSFPHEKESPGINYQMADLMLENKDYGQAAIAFENTSYKYPLHEKSSAAGYAAVYAYREYLKVVDQGKRAEVKQQIIRSSLKFADTYPKHKKVTIVLGAAADDLYGMKNYELAIKTAHKLIDNYPNAEKDLMRSAWEVVGHSSFELMKYADAENGYKHVLALMSPNDKDRSKLLDNLAASVYKQGEEANKLQDYKTAAEHFLRVGKLAPNSKIRPTAEYDGAAALIQLKDWTRAAAVLVAFRKNYPNHKLQPEVTKKIAFVYRSDGKLALAAAEYERIERESKDEEVRRGALSIAAELYKETGAKQRELAVYKRYVGFFPHPIEEALEIYHKMAAVYESLSEQVMYQATLKKIVDIDRTAGEERTDRTRYLGAEAALVITKPLYDEYAEIKLVKPFKVNLQKKQKALKAAINGYSKLVDYQVADVTAAATYYMAEIYYQFSRALTTSERPDNLSALELEQYNLAIEDQAYPFEDKAIEVHKKNIELLYTGIYNDWIEKSIGKLAKLFPASYARSEKHLGFINTIASYHYAYKVIAPKGAAGSAAAVNSAKTATPQTTAGDAGSAAAQQTATESTQSADKVENAAPQQDSAAPAETAPANADETVTEAPAADAEQPQQSAPAESLPEATPTNAGEAVTEPPAADAEQPQQSAPADGGEEAVPAQDANTQEGSGDAQAATDAPAQTSEGQAEATPVTTTEDAGKAQSEEPNAAAAETAQPSSDVQSTGGEDKPSGTTAQPAEKVDDKTAAGAN